MDNPVATWLATRITGSPTALHNGDFGLFGLRPMADSVLIIIPARMASTRLPGKPLIDIAGEPMIVHVLRRAEAAGVGDVVVATDSEAIAACVEKAGGRAVMTRADHVSGSDRVFEAAEIVDPNHRAKIIANMQGDMPTLAPSDIKAAVALLSDPAVLIGTLASKLRRDADWENPNVVKVTGRRLGSDRLQARVFTRSVASPIRSLQASEDPAELNFSIGIVINRQRPEFYHHIGLYVYRRNALANFISLPPAVSEQRESLEQLRALEAGMRIDVAIVDSVPLGVDTPEDLERARALLSGSR
jgi:3-deoxy-manno-octulosonate cytidylyltransferase (CMP-KDO synthetase)